MTKTKTARRTSPKSATARRRKRLDGSLTELTHADLVRLLDARDAEYIFKHALVQDPAYASLLKQERVRLHLDIAHVLEQTHANNLDEIAARLAMHYQEAGDERKTAEYSERAGDVAARAFANPEASAHYWRALQAIRRMPDELETRRKQLDLIIKYDEYSWGRLETQDNLTSLAEMETLARSLPEVSLPASQDRMRLAYIHNTQGSSYVARGEIDRAMPYFQQVLQEASVSIDAQLMASASALIAGVLVFQGHFSQALPYIEQARAAAQDLPHTWYNMASHAYHAQSLAALGQFAPAMGEMREVLAREQAAGYHAGISMALTLLGIVCNISDANAEALAFATEAIDASQKSNEPLYILIALSSKSLAQSRLKQSAAARQDLAQALAMIRQAGGQTFGGDWVMVACAETALNVGDMEQALALAQETVNYAQRVAGLYAEGVARRIWAQALMRQPNAPSQEIEQLIEASANALKICEARPELARTQLAWGQVLMALGEHNAARTHLREAERLLQACALENELEQVRALLLNP